MNYKYDHQDAAEYTQVESGKGARKASAAGGARAAPRPRTATVQRGAPAGRPGDRRGAAGAPYGSGRQQGNTGRPGAGGQGGAGGQQFRNKDQRWNREPTVKPDADWNELEVADLTQLQKLSTAPPTDIQDLRWAGNLASYDEDYDRVNTKTAKKLRRFENLDFPLMQLSSDGIIQELAGEDAGNVYVADSVLAHIMGARQSVYPWDIVITHLPGGAILLDVRDPLEFEMHTVHETSHAPPAEGDAEDINGRVQLSLEATAVHQNFSQQVLVPNSKGAAAAENDKPLDGEPKLEPSPFFDADEAEAGHLPAAMAFRYRRFNLGGDIQVVARTTINAIQRKKATNTTQYLSIVSLHEWDPKGMGNTLGWRSTVDAQRGNLLATEIRANAMKLAKFTISAMLAGADHMRIGLVSRATKSDSDNHVVLGTHSVVPSTFAQQLQLNPANMWGVVRWLVETVRKHAKNLSPEDDEPLKFVLVRDANKPQIKLYNVPWETFDDGDDEDGNDDVYGDDVADDGGAEWAGGQ